MYGPEDKTSWYGQDRKKLRAKIAGSKSFKSSSVCLSLLHSNSYPYDSNIYIYIYTNLISTSIHGTRKKTEKKNRQGQEIKISRITARFSFSFSFFNKTKVFLFLFILFFVYFFSLCKF